MDYGDSCRVRMLLTDEELQFPAIDELCNKFLEWLAVSKEAGSGRKTRSAIKKLDSIYEDIMSYKLPAIQLINNPLSSAAINAQSKTNDHNTNKTHSANSSMESSMSDSSTSSRPITRSLRSRSRTPTLQQAQQSTNQRQQLVRQPNAPSTPSNQRIRAQMKQPASGSSTSSSASKIRQTLRADSAQKKRFEEKERQERLMLDRKMKEERAEAQKKQLLEERAVTAKMKREQRLLHAAEVRKAREEAKQLAKLREQEIKRAAAQMNLVTPEKKIPQHDPPPMPKKDTKEEQKQKLNHLDTEATQNKQNETYQEVKMKAPILNETFKKPSAAADNDNIDISIQDETTEEAKDKVKKVAQWTRAPHLREALIEQFSKSDKQRHQDVLNIFPAVELPVDLDQIFGPNKAVNNRYLYRTSSAVWTPPHRALKRASSMIDSTPDGKH